MCRTNNIAGQENKKVSDKRGCQCFLCQHKDEPELLKAYCTGFRDASKWFLNWAEKNKIKLGSIADNDLSGIYAQIKCNYDENNCYMAELPDIEEK